MLPYQHQFIEFAIKTNVLKFGEFTLKSGRVSPYFFNSGLFNCGGSLLQLSRFYATSIEHEDIEFDVLFGPAYKGITLACGTAMVLSENNGHPTPFAYNRKEVKDHGEGGNLVGAEIKGKVAIIDDVITAGTAIRESFQLIREAGAEVSAVYIALDRQERGQDGDTMLDESAIQQVEREFDVPVVPIATFTDLIGYVEEHQQDHPYLQQMHTYREQYGVE